MNLTQWLCDKSRNERNTEIIREAYRRWHKEKTSLTWKDWVKHVQSEHNGEIE